MGKPTYLPEARKAIVEMLEQAMTAWLKQMQQESFSAPMSTENLSLMLEATSTALFKLLEKSPDRDALLRTFALEMLDQSSKE